ncbi:hypothetical protein PC118_g1375 [Phytophthora cactorum]|uniref:Uncharacterized protein n=2 Tax=Phytophthora cactorum TaxID=29920 RepID=A0A8T1DQ50_9STRA|nr:hypothetical protein PC111_g1192 [Phytophthora cactorum]KAG2867572.1 hypothetical protein PC113_g1864 [Phytophthora cactorum]KAG2942640.1 hypothetical protein PC115_g1351 [Phytophthora cactorum]KAG2998241.1 hypothetical protein PC118_g1375 [Phytophthora cactorum]KAG3103935.1 hypothetical protein PC122_g1565 [Phytophthora cactorum]
MPKHINEAAVTVADMPLSAFAPSTHSEFEDATLSQASLRDIDLSESLQRIIEKSNASEPEHENKPTPCQTECLRSESVFESTAGKKKRGVDFNIPHPRQGKTRKNLRQKWPVVAAKLRYVLVEYPKGLTTKVTDVVKWAQPTTWMNDVTDILEKYPCIMNEQTLRGRVRRVEEVTQPSTSSYCYSHVIPYDLIVSLQAALDNFTICRQKERNARHEMPEVVDLTSTLSSADDKTLAVWVTPQPKPFSR